MNGIRRCVPSPLKRERERESSSGWRSLCLSVVGCIRTTQSRNHKPVICENGCMHYWVAQLAVRRRSGGPGPAAFLLPTNYIGFQLLAWFFFPLFELRIEISRFLTNGKQLNIGRQNKGSRRPPPSVGPSGLVWSFRPVSVGAVRSFVRSHSTPQQCL